MRNCSWILVGVVCTLLTVGCQTKPPHLVEYGAGAAGAAGPAGVAEEWPAPAEPRVILQPGDILKFQFLNHPELADEQMVRPDGKVSLQLIGEVPAGGLTPGEIQRELMQAYTNKIKNPEINVVVKTLDSRRVYVGGEVKTSGFIPLTSQMTALQAIMQSGGWIKETAQLRNVIVIRLREGRQHARTIDMRYAVYAPESKPFYLEPNDIIYVPRTMIDRVDQWVDQHINKIIPRNIYYSYTDSNLGNETNESRNQTFQFVLP